MMRIKSVVFSFFILISFFANASPILLKSTNKIASKVFTKSDISKAVKNNAIIKLRYKGERDKGNDNTVILSQDDALIKIELAKNINKESQLLIIAESLGGDLSSKGTIEPLIINSFVSNLRYFQVRLPHGELCKNNKYLVTVFLKDKEKTYWNHRKTNIPTGDCGGF